MYTHTYIHTYRHACIHTYIHTYIHAHTPDGYAGYTVQQEQLLRMLVDSAPQVDVPPSAAPPRSHKIGARTPATTPEGGETRGSRQRGRGLRREEDPLDHVTDHDDASPLIDIKQLLSGVARLHDEVAVVTVTL